MVVDASVWVSALVSQDVHHAASRAWLEQATTTNESLIIPALALAEVAGAIARRTASFDLGLQALAQLLDIPGLQIVALDHTLGAEAARTAATMLLRGADATYVAVARSLNEPLLTLDLELHRRAGSVIQVVLP